MRRVHSFFPYNVTDARSLRSSNHIIRYTDYCGQAVFSFRQRPEGTHADYSSDLHLDCDGTAHAHAHAHVHVGLAAHPHRAARAHPPSSHEPHVRLEVEDRGLRHLPEHCEQHGLEEQPHRVRLGRRLQVEREVGAAAGRTEGHGQGTIVEE